MVAVLMGVFLCAGIASAATVEIKVKDGIGNYLTVSKGMTLYLFKKDVQGVSACKGPCVDKWPLFYASEVTAGEGVSSSDFGVLKREDGKMQTTYKGLPLYYFFMDKEIGDVKGQGFNGVWTVAVP
jgi:predicted lipoprotein with Yx(FWY)xxD motif